MRDRGRGSRGAVVDPRARERESETLDIRVSGGATVLSSARLMGFVATADAVRARRFYQRMLGHRLVSEDAFALVFESGGNQLRIQIVTEFQPQPFTVLGWQVPDIRAAAAALAAGGVVFERYAGMEQDELGVWRSPGGARVAWFKDPDGNLLSVTEPAAG